MHVEVTEANVPPDEIQFLPAGPIFDDAPTGTVIGYLQGKDHNPWALAGSTFVSITPCRAPLSSNVPPGVDSSVISVLPINCSSGPCLCMSLCVSVLSESQHFMPN
jgi:hypothetical protein